MASTSTADNPDLQTSSLAFVHTPTSLCYAVTHVFLPVHPPVESDYTPENEHSLARAVCAAAHAYATHVCEPSEQAQWHRIAKMLDNLQASIQSEHMDNDIVISQLRGMQTGDILAFFIRHQNTAIILTKQGDCTLCEVFQVSPSKDAVEQTPEPLICLYPGSAVEMPNEVFDDGAFQSELAYFLSRPPAVDSDSPLPLSSPSRYIMLLIGILHNVGHAGDVTEQTALLTSTLHGVDRTADVPRIMKRLRDYVGHLPMYKGKVKDAWRRSPLWLLIRVAIQMTLDRSLGVASYKRFMLFFMCTLARDENNTTLSSDLLHLMSSKLLRRLSKLGSSTPDFSEMALETCPYLGEILDARWKQLNVRLSPFQNPSQDELNRDTKLSLRGSRNYIRNVLANPCPASVTTPFHPSHRRRGTIEDFLSSNGSFFDEAYCVDPDVTLYDVEQSVEHGMDGWIACVTNVDEACTQLKILMDKWQEQVTDSKEISGPEDLSIQLLTMIELYVALDKLVVREIPILADYSPEIPVAFLERLLLRKTTSIHRLACAYQHLSVRHSQSRSGWSVLLDEFTEDSFPVRYYDQSPHLQQLMARIERDAMDKVAGRPNLQYEGSGLTPGRGLAECAQSPLPASPLHAKVVVFELQCPACIRIWRSAALGILELFYDGVLHSCDVKGHHLLGRMPALQPYFLKREPTFELEIHLAYFYPEGSNDPILRYVGQFSNSEQKDRLWVRQPERGSYNFNLAYRSNSVALYCTYEGLLFAEAREKFAELSLNEFVEFGYLRSKGSLHWLNILHGLRSRTLNLRRHRVHYLISRVAFQVGPLDLNTGAWIWHEELQDSCFCNALLDELDSLFADIGACSIDGVLMNTISLLLTRVLASRPSERISDRAIALLRSVRRKTFSWVQELSYDLSMAPMNKERRDLLWDMAATCRSTFDVDPATLRKLLCSPEDVDALLTCAFFIHALCPENIDDDDIYSRLLRDRDISLSLALEETLRDVILADVSDYGVDLAVGKIFVSYRPGIHRWKRLWHPNDRWLTCETQAIADEAVHINLLDAELRVAGEQLAHLPRKQSQEYEQIFRDQGFFVVPSDHAGMDSMTFTMMSSHKVHFSWKDDQLVVRAQRNQTNDILALIPQRKLRRDLPSALVDGHVHWLNLSTKTIEIRPLERLWEESSENWTMQCATRQYRMYKGHEALVDIRSPTWETASKWFERLNNVFHDASGHTESKNNILITTSLIDSATMLQLSVTLPHYGLSFFVNEMEELESRDFKDMVYDENQCVGALLGLENLLVLRPKTRPAGSLIPETLIPRRVLIPDGDPKKHGDHQVRIRVFSGRIGHNEVLYHTYAVDTELGCLIGDGRFRSTLYLADLHALTSCHRPDPLTGKTGAQAALFILHSAGCWSIMKSNPKAFGYASAMWSDTQALTKYPQINIARKEIRERYYWIRGVHKGEPISAQEKHAARRAAHLFPLHAVVPTSLKDHDYNQTRSNYLTSHVLTKPGPSTLSRAVPSQITLDRLFFNRPAPPLPQPSILFHDNRARKTSSDGVPALDQLLSSLHADSSFQREYCNGLYASAQYHVESQMACGMSAENRIEALEKHHVQCRVKYLDSLKILKISLGPTTNSPYEETLALFGQWPPITADVLLRYLASASPIVIPSRWKKCLTSLALLLLELQRARRLLRFALDGLEEEFLKELENTGCDGWDPEEYPDWLLIQVQGNFLIRRTQAQTAMEIMSPGSGENTVMQVDIGGGKSSVIIPIVAAALADGKQLVRVVVPKALTVQMFDLLVSRLGGLTNRPIYHLPFSRTHEYDHRGNIIDLQIDDLQRLMSQCMAEHGILLVQPEHVVSLKLMTVEEQIRECKLTADQLPNNSKSTRKHITALSLRLSSGDSHVANIFRLLNKSQNSSCEKDNRQADHNDKHSTDSHGASDSASKWLSLQKWIHSYARDVLDESDEILHSRFQLIYTIGLQQHMDGYPERWTITQQILRLVKHRAGAISGNYLNFAEHERGPSGSFPHIYAVRASDFGRRLISLIVGDVMAGRLPHFRFQHISSSLRDAICSFISDEDVLQVPDTAKRVEEYAKHSHQSYTWNGLLLLRGLLASNMLLFALTERRWRVDYGLASQQQDEEDSRANTLLAVPYRAKDVPARDTQFGHPDITIILTCLSYYYGGLSEEQLRVSFEMLLDQDDPSIEYALWITEYDCKSVPDSVWKLSDLNLKSSEQWDKVIFPLFSMNQAAIDFYLSRVVFPKEAKEFPYKLSASSWDLGERRERLITGFSGTNDGRWLLPMSITQRDLDHQQGTNAKVLAYLLQPENNFYIVTQENGERQTTLDFLRLVTMQQPKIRVLLDVGAQILDLSNRQVAEAWLGVVRDTAGAIYFNENDELMVLAGSGITQPILSSPLCQQLDRCVVYLDHVHTRGTDIRFPIGSRAAITLGPKVTKDALVQGCMRMRKLGHGHSVMFFAPPEVDRSIRAVTSRTDATIQVTTVDVLCWAIRETWTDIQQRAPYWAQQGMQHKSRYNAWSQFCNNELAPEQLSDAWLQPEQKSLADLYAPHESKNTHTDISVLAPEIRQRCKDLGILSLPSAQMEEEQEREVNREREREREVELPPEVEPAEKFLHPDVVAFVKTGIIPPLQSGSAFLPVFTTLEKSSAATREADVWSPFILATADFCRTIKPESTQGTMDQYFRRVQWILSRRKHDRRDQVLVVLSPFEADLLTPDIRASEYVHLHLYAPRTSQRMKPSDDLRLYSIPPLPSDWTPPWDLIDQLNVFSGQLYLRDYQSYLRLCRFLDVPTKESSNDIPIRRNLFNIPGSFEEMEITFAGSPLPCVMALLAIRTRGRPFAHTHMGRMLQGQLLSEKDFEDPTSDASDHHPTIYPRPTPPDSHILLSPSDIECDTPDHPRSSSTLIRPHKRGLETVGISEVDLQPPQKRVRTDSSQ
ncbi:hypothetical protein OG21DRAFT_1504871 [Imleria badia]|nr:hypothetical protein OG21DRAFT_1504871 [Imleria badia]